MKICKDKILGVECEMCCCECSKEDCNIRCEEPEGPCEYREEKLNG